MAFRFPLFGFLYNNYIGHLHPWQAHDEDYASFIFFLTSLWRPNDAMAH